MYLFFQKNDVFNELVDLIPGHICVLNELGEIVFANTSWKNFYRAGTVANFPGLVVGTDCLNECLRWNILSDEQIIGIQSVLHRKILIYETVYSCHFLDEEKWFLLQAVCPLDKVGCMIFMFDVSEREIAHNKNINNEAILKSLIDNSPAIIYMKDMSGKYTHVNKVFEQILDIKKSDIIGNKPYEVFPWEIADRFVKNDRKVLGDLKPLVVEEQFCVREEVKTFHSLQFPLRGDGGEPIGIAGISSDISERKRSEGFLFFQNKVLQNMVHESSLKKVLEFIVIGIEKQTDDLKGSILLLDETGKYLSEGVAPNLPKEYFEVINGIPIGACAGSCGTAAYRKEIVIVADISSDPLWKDFKNIALSSNLGACWSIPIVDREGAVLGTFALYYNKPNQPSDWELGMMESVAQLASLAIEQKRTQGDLLKYKRELEDSLNFNEERLQLFLAATTDGVWDWNMVTDEVFFSPHWLKSLGYYPGELKPHIDSWKQLIHPDDMPNVVTALNDYFEGRTDNYQCENRLLKKDGSWRWNLDQAQIVKRDENGHPLRMVGADTDITRLKEAEFALRATEQNLAQAQEMASLGSWELDVKNNCLLWSDEVYKIFGQERQIFNPSYENFLKTIHPEDRGWVEYINNKSIKEKKPCDIIHRIIIPDGSIRIVQAKFKTFYDEKGEPDKIIGTVLDITDRKIAEENLKKSHQQLRNLSNKLQTVREEDKKRISREIHDELGQTLTAIKLDLTWLEKRIDISEPPMRDKIESIYIHLQDCLDTVRRVSTELRPQVLDVMGFCEALQWQAEKFRENTNIGYTLDIEPNIIKLQSELSTDLFRIFQEALTNIARYSEASNVMISFVENKSVYQLCVEDNGVGIPASKIDHSNSLGLLGIRERVLIWKGHVEIKGIAGVGTFLKVEIPKVKNDF